MKKFDYYLFKLLELIQVMAVFGILHGFYQFYFTEEYYSGMFKLVVNSITVGGSGFGIYYAKRTEREIKEREDERNKK